MNLFVYNNNTLTFSQGAMKSKNSLLTLRTHPLQLSTLTVTNSLRETQCGCGARGSLVSEPRLGHRTCASGCSQGASPEECRARDKSRRRLNSAPSASRAWSWNVLFLQ